MQVYKTHHWSVSQHRDQVRGRAGGITSALTNPKTRLYKQLHEEIARDCAIYDECIAAGMTPVEAHDEVRRRNNAAVLAATFLKAVRR